MCLLEFNLRGSMQLCSFVQTRVIQLELFVGSERKPERNPKICGLFVCVINPDWEILQKIAFKFDKE